MMKYKGKNISRTRYMELKRAKKNREHATPRIGVSRAMYNQLQKNGFRV